MYRRLKKLLAGRPGSKAAGRPDHDARKIAAAALMIEAAYMDGRFEEAERRVITRLLRERFELAEAQIADLMREAEAAQAEANHLIRFTRIIKDAFDEEARIGLVEMLWEVVYADGVAHHYESNLLRRLCGLIYVSDRDSGSARKRVLSRLGLEAGN
jgi:uncharacterized tellurite resistance protein B-like protein